MNPRSASICDRSWAIQIRDVARSFPRQISKTTLFRALASHLFNGHESSNRRFYALKEINLDVVKGDKVALVGDNGAGKTTLLKVIGGLYKPTAGEVRTRGEMVLLRGAEIGMVDELSAAENLFLYSSIYGVDREKIKTNFEEIFEWAELRPFAGARLATLSSGMRARLAFSALRHFDAEIFLLDEAFSAVDRHFEKKYQQVFEEQKNSDKTFLIATHDINFARMFCTKTLWLSRGQQMAFDSTDKVLDQYIAANA
jgi:ABC-type polysaccharide/polyol phosphate transport system ATPase subunit